MIQVMSSRQADELLSQTIGTLNHLVDLIRSDDTAFDLNMEEYFVNTLSDLADGLRDLRSEYLDAVVEKLDSLCAPG